MYKNPFQQLSFFKWKVLFDDKTLLKCHKKNKYCVRKTLKIPISSHKCIKADHFKHWQ